MALGGFGLFATHDVVVKSLGATYTPFQIVFFSVLFSFPLAVFMLMRDQASGSLRPVNPGWMAARTAAVVVTGLGAFFAFSTLPLAQTYAILFAAPLLITLLAIPILGERVRLRRGLAVVVGLGGVLVVLRPTSAPLELGHLAALMAAMGGALASVIVRKIGPSERSVVLMVYPMMANFILMACVMPFVYKPMPVEHLGGMLVIAGLAFVAMMLMISAYRAGEAMIVAPMQYSQILWAAVYGTLFFDEGLDLWTGVGAGIIIASGLYIVLREGRSDASGTRPVLRTRARPETGTSPRPGPVPEQQSTP